MNQDKISKNYIAQGRARSLEIGDCYINKNWKEIGMANIIVSRKHKTGNLTIGFYLVDTYGLGVKDCFFEFNITPDEFNFLLQRFNSQLKLKKESYALLHNIIYGAVAYAEKLNFKPCKEFKIVQLILEEKDKIEHIEIEFGKDGKPLIIL